MAAEPNPYQSPSTQGSMRSEESLRMEKRRPFTLLEFLVVVAIILWLVALIIPASKGSRSRPMRNSLQQEATERTGE